jgi:glycosyltransferase involved in cell wall biosynthesis
MKICVLGLRGIPQVVGGVETHCEQLIPRLQKRRPSDQYTVIGRRSYCPHSTFECDGVRVVALPHLSNKYLEAVSNATLGLLYARFRVHAEVVHIHAIGPALVSPLAKALGMKVLVTHHGADYDRDRWNAFAKTVLRIGEFCALRFADQVIVVSPSLTVQLKSRYRSRASRISFVPNGATHILQLAATEIERHSVLERFGLVRGKYIATVGRLVPEKGFDDLIRSFKSVNHPSKLVIIGGASMGDPYAERLQREAGEGVVFTGYLKPPEITALLQEASLFVLASRHEGLPIAALEAAILGCPILLSDIRPNLDIGLAEVNYFKVGDMDDLRRKLAEPYGTFLVDPTTILNRYDWDKISETTSAVYSALIRPASNSLAQTLIARLYRFGGRSPAPLRRESAAQAPAPLYGEPPVGALSLQRQKGPSQQHPRTAPPSHQG